MMTKPDGPMGQFNAALKKRQAPAVSGAVAAVIGDGRVSEAVRRAAKFLAESGDPAAVSDGGARVREAVEHLDLVVKGFGPGSAEASAAVRELERATADAEQQWVTEHLTQPAALSAGVNLSTAAPARRAARNALEVVAATTDGRIQCRLPGGKCVARTPAVRQRAITIDANRVRRWCSQFSRMRSLGLRVPVCWGHQLSALPDAADDAEAYRRAKLNAGYLSGLEPDGAGGVLMTLDVPNTRLQRGHLVSTAKLAGGQVVTTAIREVSPFIGSGWIDGKGRTWNDFIAHLALTPYPVVAGQAGFTALSGKAAVRGYYVGR
jgi:hypothetical protein